MPQPLRETLPFHEYERGPMALSARPDLAVRIACVATAWGGCERALEMLVLIMLREDAKIGHTIYSALTGSMAQRAVLDAIAQERLDDGERAQFKNLMKKFAGCGGERNDIVHGVWACHEKYPDALILIDMREQIAALASWESGKRPAEGALNAGRHMIYKASCFMQTLGRMEVLVRDWYTLGTVVRDRMKAKGA